MVKHIGSSANRLALQGCGVELRCDLHRLSPVGVRFFKPLLRCFPSDQSHNQEGRTGYESAEYSCPAGHSKPTGSKGTSSEKGECGICCGSTAQRRNRRSGRSEGQRLCGTICTEGSQCASGCSGDRSARNRACKVGHTTKLYKFLLVNMKPMEFIQPFRLLEIHIFDLCEHIQKVGNRSVQNSHLFCPQPGQ